MRRSTRIVALLLVIALVGLTLAAVAGSAFKQGASDQRASVKPVGDAEGSGEEEAKGEEDEVLERRMTARARIEAFRIAERQGRTAVSDSGPGPRVSVAGWGNEKVFSRFNDWEPNVAADPSSGYVYMLTTEYGGPKACKKNCPGPSIRLRISSDGGHTFGPASFLCKCRGHSWQADPIINTDADGDVYAAWLTNPFGTVFSRSTDHGQTWTDPVQVMPPSKKIPWNDHPWMAVSDSGQDVYIGANKRDNYQVSSHDFGATWSEPVKTNPLGDYYFALGGAVMSNGDVIFSDAAFNCCGAGTSTGPVDIVIIRSTDGGATWSEQVIATSAPMPLCKAPGCPAYQYGSEVSVAANGNGDLLAAYTAARRKRGGERVYAVRSTDNGVTWSDPVSLSPRAGVIAVFPQVAGGAEGRFAVAWADNRNGGRRFNTWERDSFDSGLTFGPDAQISNLGHGAGYKHPAGYQFSYGDYFDIAVNNVGQAFSAWGEGYSYNGPGGTWYNVQN